MEFENELSRLISLIYDAALDESVWPRVLEETCRYAPGIAAVLASHDATDSRAQFHFSWGDDPAYTRSYIETYARINPLLLPLEIHGRPGEVLAIPDVLPYEEYLASRTYREWSRPQGYIDAINITLERTATSVVSVMVARHERHGMVDDESKRRMALLAPHFTRAVTIGKLVERKTVVADELTQVLDALGTAIYLVDEHRRVIHANASAQRLMHRADLVRLREQTVHVTDQAADRILQAALSSVGRGGDAALAAVEPGVVVRSTDGTPYVAHLLPLTSGARRQVASPNSAVAAVFITKAKLDGPHPLRALSKAYQLSLAELRVLMAVFEIGGVPEIAPVLGIAEPTVRTHLQRLFEKTGVNRQADLVKLVAGFFSPLEP